MPVRKGSAIWRGDLKSGEGTFTTETGTCGGRYSFSSRFEQGEGSNPEELIAAAHASCFSMALAGILAEEGFRPRQLATTASVTVEKQGDGFAISAVELQTRAEVPDIDAGDFQEKARKAKENCPVSRALQGVEIRLEAGLIQQTTPAD